MAVYTWTIEIDSEPYLIELEHGIFSGKRVIHVNGTMVYQARKTLDVGTSEHPFQINAHVCLIKIHAGATSFTYDFYIDGESQGIQKLTLRQILRTMPFWGWLFQLLNWIIVFFVFIPITGLQGFAQIIHVLIVGTISLVFFYAIWIISSHKAQPLWLRLVLCLLLVIVHGIIAVVVFLEACACQMVV